MTRRSRKVVISTRARNVEWRNPLRYPNHVPARTGRCFSCCHPRRGSAVVSEVDLKSGPHVITLPRLNSEIGPIDLDRNAAILIRSCITRSVERNLVLEKLALVIASVTGSSANYIHQPRGHCHLLAYCDGPEGSDPLWRIVVVHREVLLLKIRHTLPGRRRNDDIKLNAAIRRVALRGNLLGRGCCETKCHYTQCKRLTTASEHKSPTIDLRTNSGSRPSLASGAPSRLHISLLTPTIELIQQPTVRRKPDCTI
jgi:hypothetical protein